MMTTTAFSGEHLLFVFCSRESRVGFSGRKVSEKAVGAAGGLGEDDEYLGIQPEDRWNFQGLLQVPLRHLVSW